MKVLQRRPRINMLALVAVRALTCGAGALDPDTVAALRARFGSEPEAFEAGLARVGRLVCGGRGAVGLSPRYVVAKLAAIAARRSVIRINMRRG